MRAYRMTGLCLLLLGGMIGIARWVVTGTWLPQDIKGVWSFLAAELFLIPLGLLSLVCGWLLDVWDARRAGSKCRLLSSAPRAVLGCFAFLLAVMLAVVVFPVVSRKLEWGRYGVPVQEPLRDPGDITSLTRIPIPRETHLVKGTIGWAGPNKHVYAVMAMSRAQAARFLKGQGGWRWRIVPPTDLPLSVPPEMKQDLAGRSRVLYAFGGNVHRSALAETIVAFYFGEDGRAVVCLYWLPM